MSFWGAEATKNLCFLYTLTAYVKPEILRGVYPELSEGPRLTCLFSIATQSLRRYDSHGELPVLYNAFINFTQIMYGNCTYPSTTRMIFIMQLPERILRDVGIYLGCNDISMTQHKLH